MAPGRRRRDPARRAPSRGGAVPRRADGTAPRSHGRGQFRTRSRRPFKPTTRRAAEQTYRLHVADRYGRVRLDRLVHVDLQEFIDELDAADTNASPIEGAILPLRLVFRWARAKGIVSVDPTDALELPEKSSRQRVPPSPQEAARLLAAVPDGDRAIWATAMLAGTRRGELLGLEWPAVDLKAGVLRVKHSHDPTSGTYGRPKSKHGVRTIPITAALAPYLREHALRSGRRTASSSERPAPARSTRAASRCVLTRHGWPWA